MQHDPVDVAALGCLLTCLRYTVPLVAGVVASIVLLPLGQAVAFACAVLVLCLLHWLFGLALARL